MFETNYLKVKNILIDIEYLSLLVSVTSLIVSLFALLVSISLTRASITKPLVLQKLLELSQYLHSRAKPTSKEELLDEIMDSVLQIRMNGLILKKAGFENELNTHVSAVQKFLRIRNEILSLQAKGILSSEKDEELITSAQNIEQANEALFKKIDERFEKIMKDPFEKSTF